VKCGGEHITTECKKLPDTPAHCASCGGDHPSNCRGCENFKEPWNNVVLNEKKYQIHQTQQLQIQVIIKLLSQQLLNSSKTSSF